MIHDALLPAVHEHPAVVDTLTVRVPAFTSTFWSSAEIDMLQEDGGGAGVGGAGVGGAGVGGAGVGGAGVGGAGVGGAVPAAACVTVNARPPIVSVPVRDAPAFAPTVNPTEPFPVPFEPDVTVIQPALLAAFHRHPAWVDTATAVPAPPAATML